MNNIPMKLDYSKTINEQLPTFEYYKNRYASYELQIINLQQELTKYKERCENAIELLTNEYESCKGALTNPEYTIVSKHQLLKNDLNTIKKLIEILENKEKK